MKYDVFQVWIEDPNPPSENELKWMKHIVDTLPQRDADEENGVEAIESTYTLISTKNYFDGVDGVKWVNPAPLIKTIKENCEYVDEMWATCLIPQFKSELVRFYWACMEGNKNAFYLDSDVEMLEWPDISSEDDGFAFFFPWSNGGTVVDCNTFFNNGNQDWVRSFYAFYLEELKKYAKRMTSVPYSFTFSRVNKFYRDAKTFRNTKVFAHECFAHHTGE